MTERRKRKGFSRQQIAAHWNVSKDYCQLCGLYDTRLQKCHIGALVDGGVDELHNMALLCGRCHRTTEGIGLQKFNQLVATTEPHRRENKKQSLWQWVVVAAQIPPIATKIAQLPKTTITYDWFIAAVVDAVAEYESEVIADRARMTHRRRKAQGKRPGRAPELPQAVRLEVAVRRAAGETLAGIAADLNDREVPTARGGRWHASTIDHVVRSVALDAQLAEAAANTRK